MIETRQQLMIFYMATSSLTSQVIAWALYDGAGYDMPCCGMEEMPPYATALEAMRDGWRVIEIAPAMFPGPNPDQELTNLKYRILLEKLVQNHDS